MKTSGTMRGILLTGFLSALFLSLDCGKYKNDRATDRRLALPSSVSGTLTLQPTGDPPSGARVTLFTPDLGFFRETRSDNQGSYSLSDIPPDSYRLGVAARGWKYEEATVDLTVGSSQQD